MDGEIKVSICCITYNHEKYIRQCLDGFVMQKTNFNYEILIHDDASTDNTREIIKKYVEKYPDTFKLFSKENQGAGSTVNSGIKHATGKYFKI